MHLKNPQEYTVVSHFDALDSLSLVTRLGNFLEAN